MLIFKLALTFHRAIDIIDDILSSKCIVFCCIEVNSIKKVALRLDATALEIHNSSLFFSPLFRNS
jgi:hypothetical protein